MDPSTGRQREPRWIPAAVKPLRIRGRSALGATILLSASILLSSIQSQQRLGAWFQEGGRAESAGEGEQVVLLNTGSILRGRVDAGPDRWTLHTGRGSLVRLELHQVDLVGDDLMHLLVQMRSRTRRDQYSERSKIARFCIQNELFEEARNEISWLEQDGLEAHNVQRLNDQLATGERVAQARRQRESLAGQTNRPGSNLPPEAQPNSSTPASSTPASSTPTLSANSSAPSSEANLSQAPTDPDSTVDPSRLVTESSGEQVLSEIDPQAFSVFVRRIQPPLLLGCAAARCHGPNGAAGFHLERLELGATPTKRMSEANYREIRRWAIEAAEGETLIDWAMKPHGGSRERGWRDDESKTTELRAWLEWIKRLEFERMRNVESSVAGRESTAAVRQASYAPSSGTVNTNDPPPSSIGDPYDPKIFNQYLETRERLRRGGTVLTPPMADPSLPFDPGAAQPMSIEERRTNPAPRMLAPPARTEVSPAPNLPGTPANSGSPSPDFPGQ